VTGGSRMSLRCRERPKQLTRIFWSIKKYRLLLMGLTVSRVYKMVREFNGTASYDE